MTVDFDLGITMNGTPEEIAALVGVIRHYSGNETAAYINCVSLNKGDKSCHLSCASEEDIKKFIEENNAPIDVSACGPYGHYCTVDEFDMFEKMADAAPGAYFKGCISGGTSYTTESVNCELVNGKMHVVTSCLCYDELSDAYLEYVKENLPFDEFIALFGLNPEVVDEDMYDELINLSLVDEELPFHEIDLESFIENLDIDAEDVDETLFVSAMEKISEMDIMDYYNFIDDDANEYGSTQKYDYDPIARTYIGRSNVVASSEPVNFNEQIREYLKDKGLPHDDETIGALSVEDVYAIIAGTYAADTANAADEADDTDDVSEVVKEFEDVTAPAAETPAELQAVEAVLPEEEVANQPLETEAADAELAPQPQTIEAAQEPAVNEVLSAPSENKSATGGKGWIGWLVTAIAAGGFLISYIASDAVMNAVNGFINSIIG